jgi:hypothetical protein
MPMPVKRRLSKGRAHRITAEAVEAYKAGDYLGLHRALELRPWEVSPLPLSVTPLGCDQDERPDDSPWNDSWEQAQELQRALEEAVRR